MTIGDLSAANKALHLADLAQANADRCNEAFHPIDSWSPTDWACAMAGECGECCNLVKKGRRISPDPSEWPPELVNRIAEEVADMVIYADLLCQRLGMSLESALRWKFNAVSEKVGSKVRL